MKEKYVYRSEFIFYIALVCYMSAKSIELSSVFNEIAIMPDIMKILRYVSYLLIFIKLLYDKVYAELEIVKIVGFVVLLAVIAKIQGNNILLCSFFFIIAARNIDVRKLLKAAFWIQLVLASGIVLLSMGGLISDWTYSIEGRNRHSLGYVYPSYIASIYFYMILCYIFLRKEKIKYWEIIIIEIINLGLFVLTDSKTSFALTFIAGLFLWGLKFYKKELKEGFISTLIYRGSVFAIAIISIFACVVYNEKNTLLNKINSFVNNRLIMGHKALSKYGLSLFGEKIKWIGYGGLGYTTNKLKGEYNFVDCSYVKILLDYGVIFFVLILLGYAMVSFYAIKRNDRYLCWCILFMCIYSMIEPRIIEFGFNPFVLTLSVIFSQEGFLRKEQELKPSIIHFN